MTITVPNNLPWKPTPSIDGGRDPLAGLKSKEYPVNGKRVQFFDIGQLAKALNRESVTLRKWEREGIIPKPTFRKKGKDIRGSRRLYTRAQVIGLIKIAIEEGVFYPHQRPIRETEFAAKAHKLFADLRREEAVAA